MIQLNEVQLKFKKAVKAARIFGGEALQFRDLEDFVRSCNGLLGPKLSEAEVRAVVAALTAELDVKMGPGGTVVDEATFERWLELRKQSTQTPRWDAYKTLLLARDWEEEVIRDLELQTDEVVELLGNPDKSGPWARKGLLMGEVQSGKTANYVGILNKAMDYGYKVIIVVGGHTNELRRQTQSRIDSDLLGIDSEYVDDNISNASLRRIGVGEIDATLRAHVMTTVRGDFNSKKKTAGVVWIDSEVPTVFVIKKNAGLIANVANYIKQQASANKLDLPLIVIDDEADWGTPNTGSDTDPTRVNREIRRLLDTSARSTYLGITATPFANIFIDDQAEADVIGADLFPSDYIRVMATPNTYFGISQYFRPDHGGIRCEVEDCIEVIPIVHKSSHFVPRIPESLKTAILSFLVGTAIRRLRSTAVEPASMLINVSRFINVQQQVFELVMEFVEGTVALIEAEFARDAGTRSSGFAAVKQVFEAEFAEFGEVEWKHVQAALVDFCGDFKVELVNGATSKERNGRRKLWSADERLREDARPTIYVGGDVLSRGLTLDGLQVSYFVREPRTMDTLTQMGRWFGYRSGYADLVRIWLPSDTADDFAWSANVTDELREMLIEMRSRSLTPKNFGLRIRTHPEGFRIAAANKSRATGQMLSGAIVWENRVIESYKVRVDDEGKSQSMHALKSLATTLCLSAVSNPGYRKESAGGYSTWLGVPLEHVQTFFAQYSAPDQCELFGAGPLGTPSMVVQSLSEAKGSDLWDVTFVNGIGENVPVRPELSMKLTIRNEFEYDHRSGIVTYDNRRIASAGNLLNSLTKEEKESLPTPAVDVENGLSGQKQVLAHIQRPRLLLYLLVTDGARRKGKSAEKPLPLAIQEPVVAAVIAYPKLDLDEATEAALRAKKYTCNSVFLRIFYGSKDGEDELDSELENE